MDRREALKIAAFAGATGVIPASVAKALEGGPVTAASMMAVYDPSLVPDAVPAFFPDADLADFEPFEDGPDRHAVKDGPMEFARWHEGQLEPEIITVPIQKIRATLDGRIPRGVFEASPRGGWIRFLHMKPDADGNMSAYSHRQPDGTRTGRAATGVAFGVVTWMVRKGVIPHVATGG